jgi:hypothetical protein
LDHKDAVQDKPVHAALELAKWMALFSMTADHWGKIVAPEHLVATHLIGRVSFPLFVWIVGTRLSLSPELGGRYLRRLVPWAVVSQPVFVVAGRPWSELNILATLALGVAAALALRDLVARPAFGRMALLAAIALVSWFAEFGPLGVAAVPATALLARRELGAGAWAAGPLGLLANLRSTLPPIAVQDLAALVATPLAHLSLASGVRLPRLPTQAFYAYYPIHLYALHLIDLHG